ncbi:DUF2786 domain-containing protein [Agitococcus lubricus]|uniref:Uncharacterized protein DUF2786 n=1 Tax=Agitococcus lubricus TaxID=1077255 RepID=A0A2T5J3Q5_9GAMM|nr:DUF2786 domain-containing protein [Agitococcus lubricus]PTQ91240.1 uncharacterized protein DUF2786 [Agitococcus lubricus]
MDKETALDKIKKLLSLAKSDNTNEAEAALRQARKLMDMHQLDITEIQASEVHEEQIPSVASKMPPTWMIRLAQTCASAFGCEIVGTQSFFEGYTFKFIGVDIAPDLSKYAYEVLARQLQKARKEFVAKQTRCKLATKRRRGEEFANAWIDAVANKVSDFAGADEQQLTAIKAYKAKHYPNLNSVPVKRRTTHGRDINAYQQGYEAGQTAQLNRGVSGQEQLAIGG